MMFGRRNINESSSYEEEVVLDEAMVMEAFFMDWASRQDASVLESFMQSQAFSILENKGYVRGSSVVRLNKEDELERRTGLIALMMAKEKNDPLFDKYEEIRGKMLSLKNDINKKYYNQSKREAKKQQDKFRKMMPPIGYTGK